MTLDQVLALLRRECEKAGGQAAWAKANDLSPAYVSDVLNKRREPGRAILAPFGIERAAVYRKVNTGGPRERGKA